VELLLARPDLFAGAVTAAAMLSDSLGAFIGSLWWPVVFCSRYDCRNRPVRLRTIPDSHLPADTAVCLTVPVYI
jgi:hypothetical protein